MTLLAECRAPALAAALEAIAWRDEDAGADLVAAIKANERVLVPSSDDGRHPLVTGPAGAEHLTAFTSPWLMLWALPWRPPVILLPVQDVLGWVRSTGRLVRLDHACEADVCLGPEEAEALLAGRPVVADEVAAGDQFRNPHPPTPAPPEVLPPPRVPQAEGEVVFAHRWDWDTRRPVGMIDAADLDDDMAGYTAVRHRADGTDVLQVGETVVVGTSYGHGEVRRWEWARFEEGLFLTETAVADDDGSDRPTPRLVVLARPDGMVRTWTARPDGSGMTTGVVASSLERWVGVPPLGVFEPLVDPDD